MRLYVSKMTTKGSSIVETLIGISIAIGLLAATLHVGTELQRKSSWEEEALTLHNIGTQVIQTFEEPLMNAGYGFGSGLLLMHWNNAGLPGPATIEHRYAVDVFPCDKHCQASQVYGQYKATPENLSDEIHVLATAPSYTRNLLDRFKESTTSSTPRWKYIIDKAYGDFEWKIGWVYAIKDKNSTWGCAMRLIVEKIDNQDIFYCESVYANYPCHCWVGEFWQKDTFRDWRVGPLDGFAARLSFNALGPWLEFSRAEYLPSVAAHGSGRLGSNLEYPRNITEWLKVSRSVLSLKASLGIPDPANPNQVLWFPDKDRNHPYISTCDEAIVGEGFARCAEIVNNQFGGLDSELDINYRHALMRRVRAIRLVLIVQSKREDEKKMELDSTGAFVANADGSFRNGKLTKRFEKTIWPPNLRDSREEAEEEEPE